ncbi:hypothetical protein ABIE39_003244, partial [Cellulosimicrobium sp. 4261]
GGVNPAEYMAGAILAVVLASCRPGPRPALTAPPPPGVGAARPAGPLPVVVPGSVCAC